MTQLHEILKFKISRAGPWEACSDSGSLAAVYLAASAGPLRVFAPIVASAAGASALVAAFSFHLASLAPAAGGPAPASAEAAFAPFLASRVALPAVVGISCPA